MTHRLPLRHRAAALAALAALLLPTARAAAADVPAVARDKWVEVRTPAFTVLANTGERKATEVALSFERFRTALQQLRPGDTHSHSVPLRVIVFDNDRSFGPYKVVADDRAGSLVGQFQQGHWADYILLNGFPRQGDALPVVYHEYVHAFVRNNFTNVPLWLEEGLAELYSTFEVDDGELLVGRADVDHVRTLREKSFLPLAELFAVDQTSPAYVEAHRVGLFYAQSWLLVHYVMVGGGERVDQMRTFLASLRAGQDDEEAFRAAFGKTMPELEKELRGYVNTPTFAYLRIPVTSLAQQPAPVVREVPAAEALYELGTSMALRAQVDVDAVRAHLDAAAAAGIPDAWASLGWMEQRLGNAAAASALFDKAAAGGATRPLSLVLRAQSMLGAGTSTPAASQAARALLRQALAADPGYVQAQALLGRTWVLGEEPPDEGIGILTAALGRLPGRSDVAWDLALLHLRKNDLPAAERLVREVVVPNGSPELVAHVERSMERARMKAVVDPAMQSGDPVRAEEALRAALADAKDPELRAELQRHLEDAAAFRARNEQIERFNAAVALANGGDLAAAEKELRELREEADESLQKTIDDVLRQIAGAGSGS
jgi:hypothetical protein